MTATFGFFRMREDAVLPARAHPTDAGYDVCATHVIEITDDIVVLGTGLCVGQWPQGWYLELHGRSSLAQRGWVLANSVGIIDNGYIGEIQIRLRRTSPTVKLDFTRPPKVAQFIPRKQEAVGMAWTETVEQTQRGSGGFGSTGAR